MVLPKSLPYQLSESIKNSDTRSNSGSYVQFYLKLCDSDTFGVFDFSERTTALPDERRNCQNPAADVNWKQSFSCQDKARRGHVISHGPSWTTRQP